MSGASANSGDSKASNVGTASRPPEANQRRHSSPGSIQEEYAVVLEVRGDQTINSAGNRLFPIIAALPERYNINMSSSWNSPFSNTSAADFAKTVVGGNLGEAVQFGMNLLSKATGVQTRLKSQSVQVWEGSSPLAFSLDLVFHAKTNTETDIRDKHLALLQLAAPSEHGPGGEVLMQPGPVIADQAWNQNSRKISLKVGKYLFFDNVIITNVGSDVETLCDAKGIPISMTINIEIATLYASFTAQDIALAFKGGK